MKVRSAAVVLLALVTAGCGTLRGDDTDAEGSTAREPDVIQPGTLTVCTSLPYEPFEFEQGGKTVGFDIDLATEVAERLDLKPVFLDEDFDAIASGQLLNEGTCDVAAAGLTITGDRARVLDFSSPYFNSAQALVVQAGSGIASLDDLAETRIAVQSGTTGETYLTDNAPGDAEIVPYNNPSKMAAAVSSGDVAAALFDNTVVGDVTADGALEVATEFDTGEQYGMAVKKNAAVDLLRTINDVLAELQENGGYDEIYAKWFGSAPKT